MAKHSRSGDDDPRRLGDPGTAAFRVDQYPFYLLNRAVSRYNPLIVAALKPLDVDVPSWRVLMVLGEAAPRSISEIADAAMINLSTMMRIVQRMTNAGLVVCGIRPDDQRVTEVALTTLGEAKLTASRAAVAPIYDAVIKGFSRREFETLIMLLHRVDGNLAALSAR